MPLFFLILYPKPYKCIQKYTFNLAFFWGLVVQSLTKFFFVSSYAHAHVHAYTRVYTHTRTWDLSRARLRILKKLYIYTNRGDRAFSSFFLIFFLSYLFISFGTFLFFRFFPFFIPFLSPFKFFKYYVK